MAELIIRKTWVVIDEARHVLGASDDGPPLRKVAACAVVANPFAGQGHVADLSEIIDASEAVGTEIGRLCRDALGSEPESYGKAGIVGMNGEQEHVHAALTTMYGDAFRNAIGGGDAWLASTKKVGAPGVTIDVPLACKEEVWVRSHYDTVTVMIPDAPLADEMVIIGAVANRGRLVPRVGGMSRDEAIARRAAG